MGYTWWHALLPCLLFFMTTRSLAKVTCPSPCTCSPKRVQCQRNQNSGLDLPQLLPSGNISQRLTTIPHHLPHNHTLTSLTIVNMDIQHITMSDFSHLLLLQKLDLTQNRIETVAAGAFQSLTGLEFLLISDNFLRQLSDDMFVGLARLKVLDVSRNRLVELTARSFLPLKNLEVLNLAGNEIEHIQDEAFVGLYRLQTLTLTGNRLMAISENQFKLLYSLQNLMLDNCSIQVIEFHTFSSLARLTHLSLASNPKLEFLLAEAFVSDSQPMLDYLSLRGTGVREVPVAALKTLTHLERLDLSQTLIPVIRNSSFPHLDRLVKLTLDALPRLHRVEEEAFAGLNSLRYLTITNNRLLNNISDGAFMNLSSLRYLDLSDNNMETLPRGLADWENLHTLDLRGNPLRCDCSAAWMLTVLYGDQKGTFSKNPGSSRVEYMCDRATGSEDKAHTAAEAVTRRVACHSPSRVAGRCLLSLTPGELCSSQSSSHGLQVGVLAAASCCLSLLLCALLFKCRRRICSACRGGYSYQMHRNRADSRRSSLVDVLEMETTQLEECRDNGFDQ